MEFNTLSQQVQSQRGMVEACTAAHTVLQKGLKQRKDAFREMREEVVRSVSYRFNSFLKRRRMSGRIAIDYTQHTLDMEVRMLPMRCDPPLMFKEGARAAALRSTTPQHTLDMEASAAL